MKHELKIHLWEGDDGEIEGHVDLPADGTFTFEAMRLILEEFCRTNGYNMSEVSRDFYGACQIKSEPKK